MNARISEGENTMKRIVILNAFALMAGTGVAMAFPCPTSDCVIDRTVILTAFALMAGIGAAMAYLSWWRWLRSTG